MGGLQIPRWLGSDPLSAWWLGLAPATLEFWVRFPNERNQGKQSHPVLKYRVPHGSHPREQLCNRSCSNKHTRKNQDQKEENGSYEKSFTTAIHAQKLK